MYQDTLQRFYGFTLYEYGRVIILDADGYPLHNLDHLFVVDMPKDVLLASPQGYWFNDNLQDGVTLHAKQCHGQPDHPLTVVTSILTVAIPSKKTFQRAFNRFGTKWIEKDGRKTRPNYDMDILNVEFACNDSILILPKHYGTLDSDFYPKGALFSRHTKCKDFGQVQFLHFSAVNKPWHHQAESAYGKYLNFFEEKVKNSLKNWYTVAHSICPTLISNI